MSSSIVLSGKDIKLLAWNIWYFHARSGTFCEHSEGFR